MSTSSCPISLVSPPKAIRRVRFTDVLLVIIRVTPVMPSCHTGYARVILAAFALYYMPYHPRYCTLLYGASSLLDAADGYAARKLGQTSQFGAVLDMIVDRYATSARHRNRVLTFCRCTTSCLLCYLASAYPNYALLFQALISLDFSSHYMHMVR